MKNRTSMGWTKRNGYAHVLLIAVGALIVASSALRADGDCDDVYKIALHVARVDKKETLEQRSQEFFSSAEGKAAAANLGVTIKAIPFTAGGSQSSQHSQQKATSSEFEQAASLGYVDTKFGTSLLKLYNDCKSGQNAVKVKFTFSATEPGTPVTGAVTVTMDASQGLQTKIRSVTPSSGLKLKNSKQLSEGAILGQSGAVAPFRLEPPERFGWVIVQTENGLAYGVLDLPSAEPAQNLSSPRGRHADFDVQANVAVWQYSGIALSDEEQAVVTVAGQDGTWSIDGKTPISYHGSGPVTAKTIAAYLPRGCLVARDGDGTIYGFSAGVEQVRIRTPGKVWFACNQQPPPKKSPPTKAAGSVKVSLQIFPLEKSVASVAPTR